MGMSSISSQVASGHLRVNGVQLAYYQGGDGNGLYHGPPFASFGPGFAIDESRTLDISNRIYITGYMVNM
jgi:hypothetical protein